MRVNKSEQVVWTDVDETLITFGDYGDNPADEISVFDPYSKKWLTCKPHLPHIMLLREKKARGATIIAMSAGGWQWARNVLIALDLQSIVDDVYSKPIMILDDLKTEKALGKTTYLNPDSKWKNYGR